MIQHKLEKFKVNRFVRQDSIMWQVASQLLLIKILTKLNTFSNKQPLDRAIILRFLRDRTPAQNSNLFIASAHQDGHRFLENSLL